MQAQCIKSILQIFSFGAIRSLNPQRSMAFILVMVSIISLAASQDLSNNISINITNLRDYVGGIEYVEGTVSRNLNANEFMWLFVCKNSTPKFGSPQEGNITVKDGKWTQRVQIDPSGTEIDNKFDIYAIIVTENDNDYLRRNIDMSIYMPGNALEKCKRTVIRRLPA
jgi:hypothetical protein